MATRAEFVNQIYQAGVASGLSDAAARVTAAQAAIESNYGESGLSADGNNFFGIKAGKSWKGDKKLYWTTEIENGKKVRKQQYFRTYATPEEGIADRMAFMESRFPDFNKAATGGEALDALQNGVYGKYFTADQAEYEGAVNRINTNYLDGTPVPPARIPGNATMQGLKDREQDRVLTAEGRNLSVPPTVPAAVRRPQFQPLPAPAPLTPRPQLAALTPSAGAAALSVTPRLGWKDDQQTWDGRETRQIIPTSSNATARLTASNVGGLGSVADDRLSQLASRQANTGAAGKALGSATANGSAALGASVKTVANPAYADWAAKYGTVTAPTMQETRDEQALMRGAAKPKATVPPAPPKTIKVTQAAPAPTGGGFDLGGMFKQGTDFLGQKANEVGNALGKTATQVQTGLAKTGQAVGDVLQSEAMKSVGVRTAFIDPIIAKAFTNKSYGATENAAAARQAVPDGFVRGASGKKLYKIGQTYQSSKGMVVATADGFRPAGSQTSAAAYAPPAKVNPAIAATTSIVKKPAAKPARTGALGYTPSNDAWFNSVTGRA